MSGTGDDPVTTSVVLLPDPDDGNPDDGNPLGVAGVGSGSEPIPATGEEASMTVVFTPVVVTPVAVAATAGAPGSVAIPSVEFESPRPLSRMVTDNAFAAILAPVSPSQGNGCHAPPTSL